MQKKIKAVVSHPLISGSFFIFSGGIMSNFFNFLFNIAMSRNLRIPDYGVLLSLISLVTLLSIPASAVTPTIVTVAGNFFSSKNSTALKSFYFKILKPFLILGGGLMILSLIFSNQIATFLNISYPYLIVLIALVIFLAYVGTINIGFLQARLSFKTISLTNILSTAFKVLLGFFLVIWGFGINGALGAYIFSFLVPVVVGVFVLRKELFGKTVEMITFSYKELAVYGIPSSIIVFCLNAYISVDIILVKHLFDAQQAGLYAGLSLVGRVIFYVTAPISTVMFPLIINKFNKSENYRSILLSALFIVGISSLFAALFYFVFSEFTILFFLKKKEYLAIANNLGHFGIFIALYSVVYILSYYFLSIKQTKIWRLLMGGVILQSIMIYVFHGDFSQIINSSIFVLTIILLSLIAFAKFRKI